MFKHCATFTDGPCQGRGSTVHTDAAQPPTLLVVFIRADGHRYALTPDSPPRHPVYHYDGPSK
jgi:hypothetical protein